MAFSFGNAAAAPSSTPPQIGGVVSGPDLEDIQTEALGFLALGGETKVQLLPTPWPAEHLPPPTSILLSIASRNGLLAAGGPDAIILARTATVRKAFTGEQSREGHSNSFQPELKLPMQMRISQIAFSTDETYLVLSAEVGGGLAVYEVSALLQGSTQPAFELSTNGQALRALIPNPTPEKGELFAVVTVDGNLMMANLHQRAFMMGQEGQILKKAVSCVSWSARGKQLIVGLGDGTAYQMTPTGEGKGEIPRPPGVDTNDHLSSMIWLENNVFLTVHTPSSFSNDNAPSSTFHVITRNPPSTFEFRKITEPAGPFGLNRSPPHYFMLRLRDFSSTLQDIIAVASSASADIGLFTRSKIPLTGDKPAETISGVFTMTELSDDSRRAQLPLSAVGMSDTSPIGLALDLSSTEKVLRPIPGDEIDESSTPLPALMVLNNEGVLAAWWVVHSDSIRQGTIFPSLVDAPPVTATKAAISQEPLGFTSTSTLTSGFSETTSHHNASPFGATRPTTSFGTASTSTVPGGAFGAPSGLGQRQSVWGSPSTSANVQTAPSHGSTTTFAAPAFGSTSTPAFGPSALPGNRPSPWGGSSGTSSVFGQAGGLGKGGFGSSTLPAVSTTPVSSSGGFASFATAKGFANAGTATTGTGSIFGARPASNAFGSAITTPAPSISSTITNTTKTLADSGKIFDAGGFVLGTSFKADPSSKDNGSPSLTEPNASFFGGGFGNALGATANVPTLENPVSVEADMDSAAPEDTSTQQPPQDVPTTMPPLDIPPLKSTISELSTPNSGLFGTPTIIPNSSVNSTTIAGFSFTQPTAKKAPSLGFSLESPTKPTNQNGIVDFTDPKLSDSQAEKESEQPPPSPKVKSEPETLSFKDFQREAPLPPETTTKDSYTTGDTSNSSTGTDAPLPPDFVPKQVTKTSHPPHHPSVVPVASASPIIEKATNSDIFPPTDVPGGPSDKDSGSDNLTEDEAETSEDGDEDSQEQESHSEGPSDEDSGDDITNDLSPPSEQNQTPAATPHSMYGAVNGRTPDSGMFGKVQRPAPVERLGNSLFGEIKRYAPALPPPIAQATSPRSPSPVRSALPNRMLRPETSRSVSAPGIASQILGARTTTAKSNGRSQTFTLSIEERQARERRRAEIKAQTELEEEQALVDDEDEVMQRHLASEITGTTTLDEFIAHSDYISRSSKESIPHQVEIVYRDINSMIDTLGFNARSLKSFVKGHTEQYKDQGRSRDDLESADEWCLVEIENLSSIIEKDLMRQLQDGAITEIATKIEACNDLQKEISRLRARHEDVKKIIESHRETNEHLVVRSQPLNAQQAVQQHDLRKEFIQFQQLLGQAEEGITLLKSKIVSHTVSAGGPNTSTGPTVEAIIRTIMKMTSMAEKRSGDVDVLEGQMRQIRLGSITSNGSREHSPFATPRSSRLLTRGPGTSSIFYTPDSIKEPRRDMRNSFISSTGSAAFESPPRKKVSGYSGEEKAQLKAKIIRRKEVSDRLRAALHKVGMNVRLMDNDE